MSCSSVTSFFWNNPPIVNKRCGEVFCSQTFDDFSINCAICSQEFNLLSFNLFIKHVKVCFGATVSDLNYANNGKEVIPNYPIKSFSTDTVKNNDDGPTLENVLDPLMFMQVEKTEVPDYVAEAETLEDAEDLCDYMDEDDLTIGDVARRKNIEEIINEYKKHPALWNFNRNEHNAETEMQYYSEIKNAVNSKLKTNFTEKELRAQILNLTSTYKRVLESKENVEKGICDWNPLFDKLWYFNKISFIGAKSIDIKIEPARNDESDLDSNDEDFSNSEDDPELRKRQEEAMHKIACEPKIISDIIAQYKKHFLLWDPTASLYNNKVARTNALRKITNFINDKFNKTLSEKDVTQQIQNLRRAYRRVERQKNQGDFRVSLWYFNDLSFIAKKPEPVNICPIPNNKMMAFPNMVDKIKVENPFDDQSLNPSEYFEERSPELTSFTTIQKPFPNSGPKSYDEKYDDASVGEAADSLPFPKQNDDKFILSLIREYERHPCLWDSELFSKSSRSQRNDANKKITNAINVKCKTNFTEAQIKKKIFQLRSSHRRALRSKEAFEKKETNANKKFKPRLWYFDKLAFINSTESKKTDEDEEGQNAIEHEDDDDSKIADADFVSEDNSEMSEQEPSDEENDSKPSKISTNKNRALLTALIEEYKKQPVLWAIKHHSNKDNIRMNAYMQIAQVINENFNANFTPKSLKTQVNKLRCSYNRMVRNKQLKRDGKPKSQLWYADLLSFIERNPKTIKRDNQDLNISLEDDEPCYSAIKKNNSSGDEEPDAKEDKLNNEEHVFQIIDLIKAAPMLWDTRLKQYNQRAVRNAAIENIISILSREHNCHLTHTEFRYQLHFLRYSYFRALRQETASKDGYTRPFFYDQMSFLKPLADSSSKTSKVEDSGEDFTFLTKNKQLMKDFIELYKTQRCLWDPEHEDKNNQLACSNAYNEIGNLFSSNNVNLTKEQVTSVVTFLHITVENTQTTLKISEPSETSEPPVWFYEHLSFLNKVPKVKDIYCNHCDQYFRKFVDYDKHSIEFVEDHPYKCFICNKEFASRHKFAYHQMTHKTPLKCDLCDFQSFTKHGFEIHMRRHKGIFKFKCEYCDKGFVTSNEFNRHSRLHSNDKRLICHICGKSLATNPELVEHLKRHFNQRDFKCEICGSAFYTAKALRGHMASHSSERQHVCDVCGGAFKRRKTLLQHKALHADRKKHECKICGKLFAQKTGLRYHMKTHGSMVGS